jgi:hypothetical protein
MSKFISSISLMCLSAILLVTVESCTKEISATSSTNASTNGTTTTSSTIAIALDSVSKDSVYIFQTCERGYFRDSIAATSLPSATTTYLDSNYKGYTLLKAFVIKDSAGTIGGYVAIINYNGLPVAVLFDASGNFVRVLEQSEPGDANGKGWHEGGRFGNRDGLSKDTVALSALPSSISSYMTTNYPNDTLIRAYINIDSSYLVISQNNGLYANLFSSTGTFIKRVNVPAPGQVPQSVTQANLPSSITTYLSTTYPSYVFNKALSYSTNGTLQGYVVFIDANNTKYAVVFDGSGNFIKAYTIW